MRVKNTAISLVVSLFLFASAVEAARPIVQQLSKSRWSIRGKTDSGGGIFSSFKGAQKQARIDVLALCEALGYSAYVLEDAERKTNHTGTVISKVVFVVARFYTAEEVENGEDDGQALECGPVPPDRVKRMRKAAIKAGAVLPD